MAGSHKRVAQAVKNRWVDADVLRGFRDLVWKSADDKTKYTRLLGHEQIPSEMIMVRRDLSQAVKDSSLELGCRSGESWRYSS